MANRSDKDWGQASRAVAKAQKLEAAGNPGLAEREWAASSRAVARAKVADAQSDLNVGDPVVDPSGGEGEVTLLYTEGGLAMALVKYDAFPGAEVWEQGDLRHLI